MNILLLISGYTCKRQPWGEGDIGTPNLENMKDFFDGGNYLKKLLKKHNVKTICALWDNIGLKEVRNFIIRNFIFHTHKKNSKVN